MQFLPDKNLILTKEQLALWDKADKKAKADGKNTLTVLLELMEEEVK